MRALLVVNPNATVTTHRTHEVLVNALANEVTVSVATTERRGHAAELARKAAADGFDLVIAIGGDGTVNEVVNGMLADGPGPDLPALGVVPGGSTNVFARALGIPNDPIEATGLLLDAIRRQRVRSVNLARADERYFTFSAGMGFDADVVGRIEGLRAQGRRSTGIRYVRLALQALFGTRERRRIPLTLTRPDAAPVPGVLLALIVNTTPWSYLGSTPITPCPKASFDTGLDMLGLTRLAPIRSLILVGWVLALRRPPRHTSVLDLHDATELTLTAERPVGFQVDGDYLGKRRQVTFRSVPKALRVLV
jgi:YegS/Rv2252/BmrU family lipid kinase